MSAGMSADGDMQRLLKDQSGRAKRRLRALMKTAHRVFDTTPLAGIIFDEDFHVADCNEASVSYFGFGSAAELEENVDYFMGSCEVVGSPGETLRNRLVRAFESGGDSFEGSFRLYDGRVIPMAIDLRRIEFGSARCVALYHRDMTESKNVNVSAEDHSALMQAVNRMSTLLMDVSEDLLDGSVDAALAELGSAAKCDMLTLMRADRRGGDGVMSICAWRADNMQDRRELGKVYDIPNWLPQLLEGRTIDSALAVAPEPERSHMKERGVVSILVVPIMVGSMFWGMMPFEHFSKVKTYSEPEREILQNAGLLVASAILRSELANDLRRARDAALKSAQAKNTFLSNMSHEIRTPMNAIMGMTEIAKSANGDIHKIEDCLAKIENASRRMMSIINDVLDMSRMEEQSVTLALEPFSFRGMMRGVVDMNIVRAGERDQKINMNVDDEIHDELIGDAQRLGQVINNLLSNALKFSPDGSAVTLEAKLVRSLPASSLIRVSVSDKGIGMDMEQVSKLFDAFEQGDASRTRRYEGLGLGLAISKHIIELMGGRIFVESVQGVGSKFSFDLALDHGDDSDAEWDMLYGDAQDPYDGTYIEYDFSGKRILVVDDVDINREIVETLMEETGAEIEQAENGRTAVDKYMARGGAFDLILMDIQMPVMDGYDATKAIRSSGLAGCESVPIVALSANSLPEDIEGSRLCGMNDHISKPIDPSVLMEKACRMMGGVARRVKS